MQVTSYTGSNSTMIVWTLAVFLLFLSLLKIVQKKLSASDTSKSLPGPWKLPLVGHLPFLGFFPHETIFKWKEKYGPIIFIQFGSYPAVVINDGALIKAAFNMPSLAGRPKIKLLDETTLNRSGFATSDGPIAKELRIVDDDDGYRRFVEDNVESATLPPLLALTVFLPKLADWFPELTGYKQRIDYPEVQEKAVEEIHTTLGTNGFPRYSDRANLPYCEALFQETLRKTTVVPLSLPHRALEDTKFQGYLIKKDTMVMGNLYAAHNDPKVWTDPESFNPERFLDSNGKLNNMEAFVMSFSTGKRKCIGENLARNQMFLFVVSILQNYRLEAATQLPSGRGVLGLTQACESFQVRVYRR
ncbi:unnamed protein product [Allacma fusca]|uniref:Cytochrome P450 n=1 Tax=Allacma fusca TaxID=39272 RepID=A0A8J2LEM9_9HEXA|nr:unnamed protein product [Allacma fusca]